MTLKTLFWHHYPANHYHILEVCTAIFKAFTNFTSSDSTAASVKEGTNIHTGLDGKLLCSYSHKLCQQRRMESFGYCIKHILEDPTAPFQQCQFISKQTTKQCTNPVALKEQDSR